MAKAKLRVLYGEGEEDILKEQAAAMEKAGHTVHQAMGRKGVEDAVKKSAFDLVVLGPTLSRNDRHHLPYMVKKASPETSVLVIMPMAAVILMWTPAPTRAPAWRRCSPGSKA